MADEHLPAELIERVRKRVKDPARRNDSNSMSANIVDLRTLIGQLGSVGAQLDGMRAHLQGFTGEFTKAMKHFGVAVPTPPGERARRDPELLAAPATNEEIAAAEAAIGRSVPPALQQLYRQIADGGFGPGGGLFPLARMIDEYRQMTREPAGPQNQAWPANLLPLIDAEPGYDCLDLDTGKVITWDPEEIDGYSNAAWERSFKSVASSLAEWLEKWLERPTVGERMQQSSADAQRSAMDSHLRYMLEFYETNPDKRSEHGLPDVGWEQEVRRRHSGR